MTRQDQNKFQQLVSDHYQYTRSGADFTADMQEKTSRDPFPTQHSNPIFTASKRLEMGRMPQQHSEYANDYQKEQSTRPDSLISTNFDDTNEMPIEHSGINSVTRVKARSVYLEHEVKNPKDFDDFVDTLVDRYIPCMLLTPRVKCSKLIIFYHANAEDIGLALEFCEDLYKKLEVDIANQVLHIDR